MKDNHYYIRKDEEEWLEWLSEHIGKGYTKFFYEDAIKNRINKLKEKK